MCLLVKIFNLESNNNKLFIHSSTRGNQVNQQRERDSNLSFTENNVSVGCWVLVHIWFVDYEEDVPGLADRHTAYSSDLTNQISVNTIHTSNFREKKHTYLLEAQFGHDFAGLLLPPALLGLTD